MLIRKLRLALSIFTLIALATCIDPYMPELNNYGSMLVVDGQITDANSSYTVKLSRSFRDQQTPPPPVTNANVYITDDAGNTSYCNNYGNGIYATDISSFKGIIGRKYVLHIVTGDGNEYASEESLMEPVPDIDTVYFEKDKQLFNNGTTSEVGLRIYLDSKPCDNDQFYRWAYEETWKFRVPNPKKYNYINEKNIVPIPPWDVKEFCWKNNKSDALLINYSNKGQSDRVVRQPICFIAPALSDRLMTEYSILVRQYSVSEKEYEFWNNLKFVNDKPGDIFGAQPYSVVSNIHNINDPSERVLGYFQVSAVKEKRIFIPFSVVRDLELPLYYYDDCVLIEESNINFQLSFDHLYSDYCITSDWAFVRPVYSETGTLEKLVFTRPECANCEAAGTSVRPDFWVDIE